MIATVVLGIAIAAIILGFKSDAVAISEGLTGATGKIQSVFAGY